jgi:hypothetical protein
VKGILLGFVLVAVCALMHAISMVFIGEWLINRGQKTGEPPSLRVSSILLSSVFAIIILLHLAEAAIWAITYDSLGLLNDFRTSLEFSLGRYTTSGASGIRLPIEWRLLGQVESIAGLLLVGLSTAFLFLVIHRMFDIRRIAHGK